jgi:hypothetical protein
MREIKMKKYGQRLISEEIKESEDKGYIYEISFHYVEGKWHLDETEIRHCKNMPNEYLSTIIKFADSVKDLIKEIEKMRKVKIVIK